MNGLDVGTVTIYPGDIPANLAEIQQAMAQSSNELEFVLFEDAGHASHADYRPIYVEVDAKGIAVLLGIVQNAWRVKQNTPVVTPVVFIRSNCIKKTSTGKPVAAFYCRKHCDVV